MTSADDDCGEASEQNFHEGQENKKEDLNYIPYMKLLTSKGTLNFLIDTGENKSFINPSHVK